MRLPAAIGGWAWLVMTGCTGAVDLGARPDSGGASETASADTAPAPDASADTAPRPDAAPPDDAAVSAGPGAVVVDEGDTVVPQTRLHLRAEWPGPGPLAAVTWQVSQPALSQSVLQPSASVPDPSFEANVAGVYTFEATMTGADGERVTRSREVTVRPESALHVELLWHTPRDPDETDEGPDAGTDLDLHFAHPLAQSAGDLDGDGAPDPWFDNSFDCFWFNNAPNWSDFDPNIDDDPSLDRDDTDGAGPENVNFAGPEVDACYRIGVHYWSDRGFGPAFATVRVYVMGRLELEDAEVELAGRDLWDVGTLCWLGGDATVTATRVCAGTHTACATPDDCGGAACGRQITPGYENELFPMGP